MHDDALAVGGEHQHIPAGPRRGPPGFVEGLEIGRGPSGQLLELAFAHFLPSGAADRRLGIAEGAAGGLQGGQPPQPVRVLLGRQVQHPVRGMDSGRTRRPVGQPGHGHLAEHRGQTTPATLLQASALDAVGAGHAAGNRVLTHRTKIKMFLQQPAHQLPGPLGQQLFQLAMRDATVSGAELRDDRLEHRPRGFERSGDIVVRVPCHRAPSLR
ncbi:hypothetical protein A8926_0138 [Saccharopolyspora spinosa]|uniref:Uncharacterized protein n=1 Tax=Saccharopolyspora spinosa TaxID=60894 RepID=A0A2N3XPS0_SACSN|nr:hypothetical protein A8926_0138 [Saccharopolyspora spinosa]